MLRVCTICALLGPAAASASAIYTVYIGAPGDMVTAVPNVRTETFNSETAGLYGPGTGHVATTLAFTSGRTTYGTYSTDAGGLYQVHAADDYGGATDPSIRGNQTNQ